MKLMIKNQTSLKFVKRMETYQEKSLKSKIYQNNLRKNITKNYKKTKKVTK